MKFGVPWNTARKGIRPEARKTAKKAARRAGASLDERLDSVILPQAEQAGAQPQARAGDRSDRTSQGELAAVNQRLDDLTRRIDQVTRARVADYAPKHHRDRPDERAALIDRLDQHLSTARSSQPPEPERPVSRPMPHLPMPPALERALAEIAARQQVLNDDPRRQRRQAVMPAARADTPAGSPETARTPPPRQDLSGLEEQLRKITDQIETLRRPGVEEAINALRAELGQIGHALDQAMPRQAIDAIERQIQGLTQRIAEGRQNGVDRNALAGIERGLGEVRDALQHLTPAENLVGFNDAIEGLVQKIGVIVAEKDPATMAQLESAITTLRGMANHVASNDTVSALAGEVQSLAEKVDHLARNSTSLDALNSLERRIDALADALAERARNGDAAPPRLEALVESLSDKIEQIQNSRGDAVALSAFEDRIAAFVQRLDASDSRLGQLEAIERGLADLLVHIRQMQANRDAAAAAGAIAPDNFAVGALKQDFGLSQDALKYDIVQAHDALKHDLVRSQDAIKDDIARAQDTLNKVHGALGELIDRLAAVEQDIRNGRPEQPLEKAEPLDLPEPVRRLAVHLVEDAPRMQAPVAAEEEQPEKMSAVGGGGATAWSRPASHLPPAPQISRLSDVEPSQFAPAAPAVDARRDRITRNETINPGLAPDQPLEPGSGPPPLRPNAAARIAASEAALGNAAPAAGAGGSKSNFIAAARRAAQAAIQQDAAAQADADESSEQGDSSMRARVMKRMKSLFVAASIVAIAVGSVQIAGNVLHWGKSNPPKITNGHKAATDTATDAPPQAALAVPEKVASTRPPALTPPTVSIDLLAPPTATVQVGDTPAQTASPEITGSIPQIASHPSSQPATAGAPAAGAPDSLPAAIGSQRLRNAAAAGDAAAAYEVAVRFAEGRGVPVDLSAAAHWYERAAKQGLAPAQFRYASLLEKGQGVTKDLAHARKLYLAAATQGNAKSMHNLAVLYTEGVDGKPDYKAAAKWFRKAAEHGVADSQYNLGILYARGIGVEKDMAQSYKWFALAARHGDKEAGRKRDEIASHLDPKQLAAARSTVEHFKATPQPKRANEVPTPPGGWGAAAASGATAHAARSYTVGKQ
jgi:localization factor PodJL